eukprot:366440-Chlamydomonas_euryale.AAC.8
MPRAVFFKATSIPTGVPRVEASGERGRITRQLTATHGGAAWLGSGRGGKCGGAAATPHVCAMRNEI